MAMSELGTEKAAVLMLALGLDEAASVMKYLEPREVQKIGTAMATMKAVPGDKLEAVLRDFIAETKKNTSFGIDSDDYIRTVLNKALGENKASSLINRILVTRDATGIESLKWMDGKAVADLVRNEHPQIIATILVHLERYHASEVLTELPTRTRNEVILRIATLEGVQPAALSELDSVLTKLLSGGEHQNKKAMGGIRATAEIMNFMNGQMEKSVMENLTSFDPNIAQQVLEKMFIFENIMDINDEGIQVILREVPSEALIIALKGAKEEMKEKIYKNMSARASETMREDLAAKGPVKLSEVEKQQREILLIVRRLSDEGQIALSSGGEDAYV
jgi:flagellar motor switch protein FliG